MNKAKKGNHVTHLIQISVNVPDWVITDLDKLADKDDVSRNTFTRKWIIEALKKEKTRRGW